MKNGRRPARPDRSMAPAHLRALLRALAHAALVSGSVTGCAGDHAMSESDESGKGNGDQTKPTDKDPTDDESIDAPDGGEVVEEKWDPIACKSDVAVVTDAQTTRPVDYLGIYRKFRVIGSGDVGTNGMSYEAAVATMGTPCSGAANVAECEQALASITLCPEGCETFAIAGSSGALSRIDSRADLLELLGNIDAVADAVLLAVYDGHALCAGSAEGRPGFGGEIRSTKDGYQTRCTWDECSTGVFYEELEVTGQGKISQIKYEEVDLSSCVLGRKPSGLCEADSPSSRTRLGRYFAHAAHLEAASVYAFEKLVRELRAFAAPAALVEAAMDAIKDELEHTEDMARLARAHGASVEVPEVTSSALRNKLDVALDNISEGCVRETYGALIATYQAQSATDPRVRAVMTKVAEDETRHARFSWELQAWLYPQLSERERALVERAKARAVMELEQTLDTGFAPQERALLGMPGTSAADQLFGGLRQTLWT